MKDRGGQEEHLRTGTVCQGQRPLGDHTEEGVKKLQWRFQNTEDARTIGHSVWRAINVQSKSKRKALCASGLGEI